jgi:protein SCO1/2
MIRKLIVFILILSAAAAASAQMKASAEVGIDEKLGSQVALDTILKDENGADVTLRQYVDKPSILVFNYFRCPGICPLILGSLVDVVNQMKLEPGKDYRLIAVSFDPTDTPAMAREKKANYLNRMKRPFSPDSWHFLTGTEESTKVVADSTGYKYRKQGDMYIHPGAIMVLSPKGVISRYLYGNSFLPADVAMAIQEAGGGQVLPSISRVLSFCYTRDPQGRGYVFSITRFAGAVILLIAVIFVVFVLRGRSKARNSNAGEGNA